VIPESLKKLPTEKEERIKIFSKITNENAYIELLANEPKIYFITDFPVFKVKNKNFIVESIRFDDQFFKNLQKEYQNGRLFVFYSFNVGYIRGAFVDNCSDYIIEDRDRKIDELIDGKKL
jgi:hypothetical protein